MENSYREFIKNYISIGREIMFLSQKEILDSLLPKEKIIDLMEETLKAHGNDNYEMPPKASIRVSGQYINEDEEKFNIAGGFAAKPAFINNGNVSGIKWISGYPSSREHFGLPPTTGLTILSDHLSGVPLSVLDATLITAERTAAVTMVGIKYLSNKSDENFGMIGCGAVGTKHVEYIQHALPNLKRIYIYDILDEAMNNLIEKVAHKVEAKIIKAESYEELVKNSNTIVSAATSSGNDEPKIKDEWIGKGKTIFLCNLQGLYEDKTMKRSQKYIVDSLADHTAYNQRGRYPNGMPEFYGELGEVVIGKKAGRESNDDLIINSNVGMAIEDMALSAALSKEALKNGFGTKLSL